MKGWRLWDCLKRSFLLPTKLFLLRVNSRHLVQPKGNLSVSLCFLCFSLFFSVSLSGFKKWVKMAGNGKGLGSLYKDIESCGEYRDIQVMWDMIHSCPPRCP